MIEPADALALVLELLRAAPELDELPDGRIALHSPRDVSTPWLRVTPIGGTEVAPMVPVLLVATFDVQAFVPADYPDATRIAHDLARRAAGVLRSAVGYGTTTAAISRVEMTTGIAYEPDDTRTPPTPRFIFTPSVYVRTITQEAA